MLLSIDAKKAFDRVNWGFIHATLIHLGLGHRTSAWTWKSKWTDYYQCSLTPATVPARDAHYHSCSAIPQEPFLCTIRDNIQGINLSALPPQKGSSVHWWPYFLSPNLTHSFLTPCRFLKNNANLYRILKSTSRKPKRSMSPWLSPRPWPPTSQLFV